jgi:hypothetical protein
MRIERLGSEWGGFWIDIDQVQRGSTAICAGIANDITFDLELIARFGCRIIGIDPTIAAQKHITNMFAENKINETNYEYIPRALWGVTGEYLECRSYRTVFGGGREGGSQSISLADLFAMRDDISLIKLDIEGSEFPVLNLLEFVPDSVRQIAVEFHHRLREVPYETADVLVCIEKMKSFGFAYIEKGADYQENLFRRS